MAALISEGSDEPFILRNVGVNPTRRGILDILALMGARIEEQLIQSDPEAELVADLRVYPSKLKGIAIPEELVPSAIDEMPILMVAAVFAEGNTIISGAEELRVKETDRIHAMLTGLRTLGVEVQEQQDGAIIRGGGMRGGSVDSFGDHRIAMAFVIAGLKSSQPIIVRDIANVATSFPQFLEQARSVGILIEEIYGQD